MRRASALLRRALISTRFALALLVLAVFLHVRWYLVDKASGAEVVSGFGASLIALGIFVGSWPYIRAGIPQMVSQGLPVYRGSFLRNAQRAREHRARVEAERPKVTRDVWTERVIAVAVVVIGTMLNGYGPLIARVLHMRGSG